MKSTPELEAEIVRLHYAEHWPVGTIATQLGAHPDQVRRVLGLGDTRAPTQLRARLVDSYRPFIDDVLARYPKLRATRLYDMLRERGYPRSASARCAVRREARPKPQDRGVLRHQTLPGEQAQVDWAHVGKPRSRRRASDVGLRDGARYSRAMWARVRAHLTVHSLCRSLVRAAPRSAACRGSGCATTPRRRPRARRAPSRDFTRRCSLVPPRCTSSPLCAVARPEHKGKVERAIRYLRGTLPRRPHVSPASMMAIAQLARVRRRNRARPSAPR